MKFKIPSSILSMALAIFAIGCSESATREEGPGVDRAPAESLAFPSERTDAIRNRADAAFEALDGASARTETRVGPQPWPDDLPAGWPVLGDATVVADTRRSAGDRLLLVNVPGSPDRAIDSYQSALRAQGYDVDRPDLEQNRRALYAQGLDHEAILTFFGREKVTRIEILLLPRATG